MKSIKNLLFVATMAAIAIGCSQASFRKTPGGMPYQLFRSKDTQEVKLGNFVKLSFTQKINDSVYFTTAGKMPLYIPISNQSNPYDISEIWTKLHLGDSLAATQMMDTFIKRMPPGNLPPQFKKGDRILTYIKVLGIFENDSLKNVDEQKERDLFTAHELANVDNYIKEKNIKAVKTALGSYIEIINPGTGDSIKTGNYVSVNYTGTTFEGKKFDSNLDSAFGHMQPLNFTVGVGEMIKGFDDAMKYMKPGGSARVYMPSSIGYGPQPPPGSTVIKPYENLIFDFTVIDVKEKAPEQPVTPPSRNK